VPCQSERKKLRMSCWLQRRAKNLATTMLASEPQKRGADGKMASIRLKLSESATLIQSPVDWSAA